MTSAARPTFLPAMGGHSLRDTKAGPQTYTSAKDLNAHLKLKLRQPGQFTPQEVKQTDLKEKLLENELKAKKKEKLELDFNQVPTDDADESSSEEEESDSESDDEDDTAELMRELEKIKQERALEKQKQEEERLQQEQVEMEERAMTGNPLLSNETSFAIKRRWDDDVIFKNQTRNEPEAPKKRFINDMLRSDFHRKFMSKYMK